MVLVCERAIYVMSIEYGNDCKFRALFPWNRQYVFSIINKVLATSVESELSDSARVLRVVINLFFLISQLLLPCDSTFINLSFHELVS